MSTQNGLHGPDDQSQAAGKPEGEAGPKDYSSLDVTSEKRTEGLSADLTNPYQPPAALSSSYAGVTGLDRRNTTLLPEPDFWVVAFLAIGVLSLATVLTGGMPIWLMLSTCGGVIRVCLIYYYRATAGLDPLPANRLLLTSSMVTFGLLLCSVIAFGSVCTAGVYALNFSNGPALVWLACCAVATIGLFIYMFKLSIGWALR